MSEDAVHVPMRRCVGCGAKHPKRSLIRFVRDREAGIVPDPAARREGRGAYLCRERRCVEKAVARGGLVRALKCPGTRTPSAEDLVSRIGLER